MSLKSLFLLTYYRNRFAQIRWGQSIQADSKIRFSIGRSASVSFGNNIIFNNARKNNFTGLKKPCSIYAGNQASLVIGDHSGFSGVSIFCTNRIVIGAHCNFGVDVSIWDTDFHPLDYEARRAHDVGKIMSGKVVIGDDVWIGAHAIILKGSRIGARSIIAAGSVVSGKIPADQVWGGNPVRFLFSLKTKTPDDDRTAD